MSTSIACRTSSILILILAAMVPSRSATASIIAYWDFNDSNLTVDQGVGTLTHNITLTDVNYQAGTTENAVGATPAGNALNMKSNSNNGKSLIFAVSTVGQQDLVMSFTVMKTSNGFNSNQVAYSTNGGSSFTNMGSVYDAPSTWPTAGPPSSLKTFNFTSITALNNNPNVQIKITLNGATNNGGMKRMDNVQFNAVPEPATLACMLLVPLGLRRRRSVQL